MGRHFGLSLASVNVDKSLAVNGETFVRVDGHTEKSRIGLQQKSNHAE
jgi:hypothetical protein